MPSRPLWCLVVLALCALGACDKTSSSQSSPASGHGDAGKRAAADSGGSDADHAGTGGAAVDAGDSGAPTGDAGMPQGGSNPNGGASAAHGGTGGSKNQGGSDAPSGGNGSAANSGSGGASAGMAGQSAGAGGQGGSAGAAGSGGAAPPVCEPPSACVGPTVDASACGMSPLAIDAPVTSSVCPGMRTCTDAAAPRYRLVDFQRLSCGTNATYGLDAFMGHPTLVAIFGSWCPYCQSQTEKLDQLRLELQAANHEVYIVIINQAGYETSQEELRSRSSVPMLQDTAQVNAWALHGVEKDDLLIYRSDGTLEAWLPPGNTNAPIDLTTDMGYAYIKMRLMSTQ